MGQEARTVSLRNRRDSNSRYEEKESMKKNLFVLFAALALTTAAFAGTQAANTNTVSPTFALTNIAIVRAPAATSPAPRASAASFATMSTAVGAQDTIANAADMTAAGNPGTMTRFIGVSIAPTNGAGLTGLTSATVT